MQTLNRFALLLRMGGMFESENLINPSSLTVDLVQLNYIDLGAIEGKGVKGMILNINVNVFISKIVNLAVLLEFLI